MNKKIFYTSSAFSAFFLRQRKTIISEQLYSISACSLKMTCIEKQNFELSNRQTVANLFPVFSMFIPVFFHNKKLRCHRKKDKRHLWLVKKVSTKYSVQCDYCLCLEKRKQWESNRVSGFFFGGPYLWLVDSIENGLEGVILGEILDRFRVIYGRH